MGDAKFAPRLVVVDRGAAFVRKGPFLVNEVDGSTPKVRNSIAQGALALGSVAVKHVKPQRRDINIIQEGW